jgi:hypothetical protein
LLKISIRGEKAIIAIAKAMIVIISILIVINRRVSLCEELLYVFSEVLSCIRVVDGGLIGVRGCGVIVIGPVVGVPHL